MVPFAALRFTARSSGLLASLLVALAGCSLINAPDEINLGSGGNPPAGGGPSTGGNGGDGGGPPTVCTAPEDCAALTTECATGDCQDSVCVAVPQPAETACGAAPTDSCDLADSCDGAGQCAPLIAANGVFCADCPAGPGQCALCQAGACNDCTDRASTKTFRSPLSTAGWQLTGSWGVYTETPPSQLFVGIPPACMDGIDNDGDGAIDFPDDLECASPTDGEGLGQCSNGVDDDADTFADFPLDPDCTAAVDDYETYDIKAFARPVLGSDGNRARPYSWNLVEQERSSATSPPTIIPATLDFLSWHVDEGSNYDRKIVEISLDGVSFTLVDGCPEQGQPSPLPFCAYVFDRAVDAWDVISLPVPAKFVGQPGYVRFSYNTTDACCDFERGWYVDALNFAADCACQGNADCALTDGTCGTGTCEGATGECFPTPQNIGMTCTGVGTPECATDPVCSPFGLCDGVAVQHEGELCTDCGDPDGLCSTCEAASCDSCATIQRFNQSSADPFIFGQWTFEGDWGVGSYVPENSVTPTMALYFSVSGADTLAPHAVPHLANDGSRAFNPSPPTIVSEIETASARSPNTLLPAMLTFRSWHQDRGGNDQFNLRDKKRIRVSTDNGSTWVPVLDCNGNNTVAFCQPWPANTNRAINDWDDISLPMPAPLIGQVGLVEFFYDTVDSGQGWERGWRIDDINIDRCVID